jgi:ABC-type molybdate transport system ATPase subunit
MQLSQRQGRLFAQTEEERLLFAKDPYVYFYEGFLKAYDKDMRKSRGVYYTPPPVVNFIVRAVHDILKSTFGIQAGLADRANSPARSLTLASKKRLEVARALAAKPKLLLLDEVLSGLNNTEIDEALGLIRDIRGGGTSIIFVEHLMRAVVALSDRVAVLNNGALIAVGTPEETMRDAEVVSVYLGKAHAS